MKSIRELLGLKEAKDKKKMKGDDPCWDNYQMVGMKKGKGGKPVPNCVPKNEEVDLDEEASVSVTVQAGAPADQKYAVTEIHPKKSPKGRTRWKDVSYHSSAEEAKTAADAHAKKNNLHRMKSIANEEVEQIDELNKDTMYSYNKKADADVETKHKSLGQMIRKGDAASANKTAHKLNKRLAGMERAEKRLSSEEVDQTAAHRRNLDLKTTVLEAVKSMKKKEVTKDKDIKKGEKLSGKQEPVKMNPALYEK